LNFWRSGGSVELDVVVLALPRYALSAIAFDPSGINASSLLRKILRSLVPAGNPFIETILLS
jgi:hypothetical protein